MIFSLSAEVAQAAPPVDSSIAAPAREIQGTSANDTLTGSADADVLYGYNGDDRLNGATGTNSLFGGAGNDRLIASDNFQLLGTSVYDGGAGFDYIIVPPISASALTVLTAGTIFTSIEGIFFETGPNEQPYQLPQLLVISSTAAKGLPSDLLLAGDKGELQISLASGDSFDASGYRFASGSGVVLSIGADPTLGGQIIASSAGDLAYGLAGHDTILGGDGADTLKGGFGNDHLYGQSPTGGPDGADTISGEEGADYIQGNAGDDVLDGGDGSDRINGGANNDLINAGEGNDTINGNLGNDTISGGADNDSLRGGQGNDSIAGDDGDDVLSGDLGRDTLTGGAGRDSFIFSGQASPVSTPDTITDFNPDQDKLILGYEPAAVLTGAVQANLSAATILAQQLFDGHAGNQEVARIAVGSDVYLFYASDGGSVADSAILLQGANITTSTSQDDAVPS